jgi:hypothetical protein
MRTKRFTTYELKKSLSKNKICIFINSGQLFFWITEDAAKIQERLKLVNELLNFKPGKLELKDLNGFIHPNDLFLILEFDNKDKAEEIIINLYKNMEFRKNIYADFWVNGKFIEENT